MYTNDEIKQIISQGENFSVEFKSGDVHAESLTKEIVAFAKNLTLADFPQEVIGHTKLVLLDTIGAMLAASDTQYPAGKILTEFVKNLGGVEEATIIGQGFRSS